MLLLRALVMDARVMELRLRTSVPGSSSSSTYSSPSTYSLREIEQRTGAPRWAEGSNGPFAAEDVDGVMSNLFNFRPFSDTLNLTPSMLTTAVADCWE